PQPIRSAAAEATVSHHPVWYIALAIRGHPLERRTALMEREKRVPLPPFEQETGVPKQREPVDPRRPEQKDRPSEAESTPFKTCPTRIFYTKKSPNSLKKFSFFRCFSFGEALALDVGKQRILAL